MSGAVAFDLDGCIIDSRAAIIPSLRVALAPVGLGDLPGDELRWLIGPPLPTALARLLERHGRDPAGADAVLRAYRADYRQHMLERTTLMPGMADAIHRIGEHRPACVVTSKPASLARPIIEHLGLLDALVFVEGPALDAGDEPKKVTLGRALDRLGPAVAGAAMVGDRHHDIDAGRAHGLTTVGVLWGIGTVEELEAAGADHLVGSPEELLAVLS
ncbi:MAG: family hydrolase [Acidimicrobiales bacterium]|nr:family hydrolase [Acidimicrobiales bacterium]